MTNSLVSKVELVISCRNLRDADLLSKSDPMVVLFIKHGTKNFIEYGRSEVVMNNLNPDFNRAFVVDYYFEEIQQLLFQIYDIDSSSSELSDHDFLGEFQCNLGELVSRARMEAFLVGYRARGKILIQCSEMDSCKQLISLSFRASGLPIGRTGCFGRPKRCNAILEMHRAATMGVQFVGELSPQTVQTCEFILAHRTEVIHNSSDPMWKRFQVRSSRLCQGELDRLLRVDVLDIRSYRRQLIGCFYTSVNDLTHRFQQQQTRFQLLARNHQQDQDNRLGSVLLDDLDVGTDFTFIDYISGGTELQFTVAIDFTASNGAQNNMRSLHFINQNLPPHLVPLNQYEIAISSVGSIIQDYDSDKWFPALGFGAKIPPNGELSHCFPLTFCNDNPFCYCVDGLLQAYRHCVRQVQLFGPTNFSPCIEHIKRYAETHADGSQYFVLLIITDGIITDIDKTVDSIVNCSFLPMSIIIVGVGDEDFSTMTMLDCDHGMLRSGMKVAERDIVQFVPLRDFLIDQDCLTNQANLARAVLAELPDQLVGWMRRHNIMPIPRQTTVPTVPSSPPIPSGDNNSNMHISPQHQTLGPPPYY